MDALVTGIIMIVILIVMLFISKNYILSFFISVFTALCLLEGGFAEGFTQFFAEGVYGQILDPAKASMVAFIALYCGYVGSMEYGGPIKGFTRFFAEHGCLNKQSVQLRAWVSSVGAFFSDLGSPGIVGTLFRSKYNELHLCRERLALLLNLTAVPVCSMIPLVGWGLFAIGIVNNAFNVIGIDELPIEAFWRAIPHYCLPVLAIITPVLLQNNKFVIGRLKVIDKNAEEDSDKYLLERKSFEVEIELAQEDGKGVTLIISLVVMIVMFVFFLGKYDQNIFTAEVYPFMLALGAAFVTSSFVVMILTWLRKEKPFMKSFRLYTDMFKRTLSVTGIMIITWFFFEVAWRTGIYQKSVQIISNYLPSVLILPIVFVFSVALSSLTGSAWGTYGVIMPLAILLCQCVGISVYAGIGATVSGSVYGDISAKNAHALHYSAESAGVDVELFRKIQNPYMLLMGISCVFAYSIGSIVDKWYVYIMISIISYIILIVIKNKCEKMEVMSNEKKLA